MNKYRKTFLYRLSIATGMTHDVLAWGFGMTPTDLWRVDRVGDLSLEALFKAMQVVDGRLEPLVTMQSELWDVQSARSQSHGSKRGKRTKKSFLPRLSAATGLTPEILAWGVGVFEAPSITSFTPDELRKFEDASQLTDKALGALMNFVDQRVGHLVALEHELRNDAEKRGKEMEGEDESERQGFFD